MGFPINFPKHGKMHQNLSNWESLENWYPFFHQSIGIFFPSDFHLMVKFTTWEMHGFSHQFLIAEENAAKSTL